MKGIKWMKEKAEHKLSSTSGTVRVICAHRQGKMFYTRDRSIYNTSAWWLDAVHQRTSCACGHVWRRGFKSKELETIRDQLYHCVETKSMVPHVWVTKLTMSKWNSTSKSAIIAQIHGKIIKIQERGQEKNMNIQQKSLLAVQAHYNRRWKICIFFKASQALPLH